MNDAGFRLVNGVMQSRFNFNGVAAAYYLKKSPDRMVTYCHPKSSRHGEKEKLSTVISFGGRGAIRGGSWYANATSCRTTYRGEGRRSAGAYSTVGFRLAADEK